MIRLLLLLVTLSLCSVTAADVPLRAKEHLPTLNLVIEEHWPDVSRRDIFGGQVEQETCPSLRHSKCWNPRTELKTSREYGFGLGQLTITSKFNNHEAARKLSPALRDWSFEERYDPRRQLITLVLMDRGPYRSIRKWGVDDANALAMMLAAYNGGLGGVINDRKICKATAGCNPNVWFGHVELHSFKAKTSVHGYGKSFFEINREYVRNILNVRSAKYGPYLRPSKSKTAP